MYVFINCVLVFIQHHDVCDSSMLICIVQMESLILLYEFHCIHIAQVYNHFSIDGNSGCFHFSFYYK